MDDGIHHAIHATRRLVVTRIIGPQDDASLLAGYRRLYGDARWQPGFDELVDLRQADMRGVTSGGLEVLARLAGQSAAPATDVFRTAIVASADLPFGIGRMYEAFSAESPETVQVFRDPETARAWLEVDPEVAL